MRPIDPGELAVAMLVGQAAEARARAAAHAAFWLGICVTDLTAHAETGPRHRARRRSRTVPARSTDIPTWAGTGASQWRRTVEDISTTLRCCAEQITAGKATYGTLADLHTAALRLRFLHPAPPVTDTPETANPLYNITIWLLDAISDCATILQAEQTLRTAAFLGHTPPDGAPTA